MLLGGRMNNSINLWKIKLQRVLNRVLTSGHFETMKLHKSTKGQVFGSLRPSQTLPDNCLVETFQIFNNF